MRRLAVLALLVAGCGGEEEASPDVSSDTATPSDTADTADDSGASDTATTDTTPDALDARTDSVADLAGDPVDQDADSGEPCADPAPRCIDCGLDFTGEDRDRPSTRVARIANDAGQLRIQDVWMEDTPPAVQLSNSWYDYIDRVAPDWVPNETLTGFDSVGSLIPIEAGQEFEVQVAFNEIMDGPTGCSAGACGTATVAYELCDGTVGTETITIARR